MNTAENHKHWTDPHQLDARAVACLEDMAKTGFFLASTQSFANYKRVWARDSIICGLSALTLDNSILHKAFENSLLLLARTQGPEGQIASNVQLNENSQPQDISYGTLVGRVDPTLWFIIGIAHYLRHTPESPHKKTLIEAVERGLKVLKAWEFNGRGFIYMPQGGSWADEYITEGYSLFTQLLYFWAQKLMAEHLGYEFDAQAAKDKINANFWPQEAAATPALHPVSHARYLREEGVPKHYLASFKLAGYCTFFDGFAHALAMLLDVPTPEQKKAILAYTDTLEQEMKAPLLPAFWPPITPDDYLWTDLKNAYAFKFSNNPYEYSNGGAWPMVNGWWFMAYDKTGATDRRDTLERGLYSTMSKEGMDFDEYLNAETMTPEGVTPCAWSAAAFVFIRQTRAGNNGLML